MIADAGAPPRHTLRRWSSAIAVACTAAASLVLALTATADAAPGRTPTVLTLADTLGAAGTSGRLAQGASNGYEVAFDQSVGLLFEVTRPTVLTEAGGFVQDPFSFPNGGDVIVEIHPAGPDGAPDRDVVIASAPVSHRLDPGFLTYQSARFATLLAPGTYYALFAMADQTPPASSNALLVGAGRLETAPGVFTTYAAPPAPGGVTHPDSYDPSVRELRLTIQAAERVIGVGLPATRDDCRAARWKSLAGLDGRPLHDAAQCLRVVATLNTQPSSRP